MANVINSNLPKEMNKKLTEQCKALGYKRTDVLGYIIDNPEIVEDICTQLLNSNLLIETIQNTTGIDMSNNSSAITTSTDNSLPPLLKKHNITVSSFLYYIIVTNAVSKIDLPKELKMKKCK